MKELSIEEKAKRYDEAISIAKEYDFSLTGVCAGDVIQDIFPELAESEDERIRKWIIENIQETLDVDGFFEEQKTMAKNAIAWLEKQGEQKPAWSKEDKMMLQYAIEHFERQKRNCIEGGGRKKAMQEFIDWLKSLKNRVLPQPKQK